MIDPCRCWVTSPPIPHADHCCFAEDATPPETPPGPPTCGHWHPDVPRPPKLSPEQARAWAGRICITCLSQPASAGRYRCNECHNAWARTEQGEVVGG